MYAGKISEQQAYILVPITLWNQMCRLLIKHHDSVQY